MDTDARAAHARRRPRRTRNPPTPRAPRPARRRGEHAASRTHSTRIPPASPGVTCRPLSSSPMPRTIASIVDGRPREDAPGGRLTSTNPARTDEVVAEVLLGDAADLRRRLPRRARGAARVGRGPRAGARPRDRAASAGSSRPTRRRSPGSSPARSASRTPSRSARCRRSSTPATSSSARAGGSTARPCRRRCPTSSCSRSACRSASRRSSPPATSPSPCPSWYLVPALLCGNAVVWKPAEYAPALGDALARALPRRRRARRRAQPRAGRRARTTFAGLERALDEGLVDKVGFTGSSAVGAKIGELCGRHLQSPCLELGGKNPMVVMDDADLDLAVEGALFCGFGTAGQRCTSLGTRDRPRVRPRRVRRQARRARCARRRSATRREDVLYGPMIHERFAERFEDWLGLIQRPPHGATARRARGRITRRQRRARASSATPTRALLPPDDRRSA